MRRALLVLYLAAFSLQMTTPFGMDQIKALLNVSISSETKITSISQEEFEKNIFVRVDLKPSLIQTFLFLASVLIPAKLKNLTLPDLHLEKKEIGLNATLSKVVLKTIELSDTDTSGILPVNQRTADVVLPTINAEFSFDYYIDFGHDRPESGNATLSVEGFRWQARFETYQESVEQRPTGPVKATLHSNNLNFTKMVGVFSEPFTQSEFDVLFEKPEIFKKVASSLIGTVISKALANFDLRQFLNIHILKSNLILGFTEPVDYPSVNLEDPDTRAISVKMHSVLSLESGEIVEGLFPVDWSQGPLSTKYTSIMITTDILNKLLKAFTWPNPSPAFTFNQALLDMLKFKLLKLDTTSMRPFFPDLERKFGENLGLYMKVYLPTYDSNQCYVKTNAGFGNIVLPAVLEVYVCTDAQTYKTSSLDACLAAGKCYLGVTNILKLLVTLPLQFTTEKKIAPGFFDLELTHVQMTPGSTEDGDALREKLNNFLDLVVPHLLPEIDIHTILAPFLVSLDSLDDQRIALGIAMDQ